MALPLILCGRHIHFERALGEVSASHYEFLGSFLGSTKEAKDSIFYSYRGYINGFAAMLDEEQAVKISKDPNVVSVFLNERIELHTTQSWNFLSLENNNGFVDSNSLWKKAKYGEDIIIGNLDSGVWPESESFSDKGYGPVPSKWNGVCQNDTKDGFPCNKKLIGVRYLYKGYASSKDGPKDHCSNCSARDYGGHGTHTLSTAGGNFVSGASVFGIDYGTAKGGAPRARVAAYKVCWSTGCSEADILKAFDYAIHDGVDVLSVSVGGKAREYFKSALSIGSFHADKHGVVVVTSAGNDGPADGSVSNVSPWLLTVAASTMDRELVNYIDLHNGMRLKGTSITKPLREDRFYPLLTGAQAKAANASDTDALLCKKEKLDPQKVNGKILVCLKGDNPRMDKSEQAAHAGAVGMILCNSKESGNTLMADAHSIPASNINYTAGLALFAYINSTNDPQGTIKGKAVELYSKPAPVMATFSSKGPNTITPEILKPDITAPGVNVIAAYTGSTLGSFNKRTTFFFESGTSMSCPHVSGIAALLKAIHPDWSPAAIRSAIMTTAKTRDNTHRPMFNGSSSVKATPFNYGAGHVHPNLAADPGLVYDLKVKDYKDFLCALGYEKTVIELFSKSHVCPNFTNPLSILNLNYPSITVPKLSGSITLRRTLKNVGSPGIYRARVRSPPGFLVIVRPDVLEFTKTDEQKNFYVTVKEAKKTKSGGYAFGHLLWSDGVHKVRSPIVVARAAPGTTK
ncbi:subtilisin-like protease SBT5.4 isoform X1 [Cornus florida]|uniref:subtilisin-like protease SBT5.4 isoform X1 n=1 Tax=Cornus florida TaxID=4283 RepID=UPI0028A158DB|nr:subtilisin-like protease SBT5.4 isoform X1 [Cornus florida]